MLTKSRPLANRISILALLLLPSPVAGGVAPGDLCSGDPCVISEDADVDVGGQLLLQFGDVDVVLEAVLDAGDTALALFARSFEIRGQGQIRGNEDVEIETTDFIQLDGERTSGTVRITSDLAFLTLVTDGSVSIAGDLVLKGDDSGSDGGSLGIEAEGAVSISGDVDLSSGNLAFGGLMDIISGAATTITGTVDLSGGEDGGGTLSIQSRGSATIDEVTVDGRGEFADGGFVEIEASGDIVITGRVRGRGADEGDDCGENGFVELASDATVRIEGELDFAARSGDCCGGAFDTSAAAVVVAAEMNFGGAGPDGCGGIVEFQFDNHFICEDDGGIDVAADGNDGDITFRSEDGELWTAPGCFVSAAGSEGDITVFSAKEVRVDGLWQAGTGNAQSRGRAGVGIEINACVVTVGATGTLASFGDDGMNQIRANDSISIEGNLTASSANRLTFAPGVVPVITGSVEPAATLDEDVTLEPCSGQAITPTPTPTGEVPTPTVSPTSTPTSVQPPTRTPTTAATATATNEATATPTGSACQQCVADCGRDCVVTVNELIIAVQISLGAFDVSRCFPADRNGDGAVTIDELIAGVNNLLTGCS